jgi:hypothetical protein
MAVRRLYGDLRRLPDRGDVLPSRGRVMTPKKMDGKDWLAFLILLAFFIVFSPVLVPVIAVTWSLRRFGWN